MKNKTTYRHAKFDIGSAVISGATSGGVSVLGKGLFGGNGKSDPKPALFWSVIGLLVLTLVVVGIFIFKKVKKC